MRRPRLSLSLPWLLSLGLFVGCPSSPGNDAGPVDGGLVDAGLVDAGLVDAGTPDAGGTDARYGHVPPPVDVPEGLAGDVWKAHYVEDIAPYWTMDTAVGTPEGNFPTFRGMDGSLQGSSERRPRMLSRQTYAYAVGYLLTGDDRLLELAKAGTDWLLAHAKDTARGGYHERLDADGNPVGNGPKYTQDLAYCMLGPAAYFFVTRDPVVEQELLATRDLLFDETKYFDAAKGRIKDGLNADLSAAVDQSNDGGAELVAQLDPINAFLLLTQPVLSEEARRAQFLDDMKRLGDVLIEQFWQDGIFWGVDTKKGQYNTRHVDFGHTLKAYWMLLEVDKRLPDHPFADFLDAHVHTWVERAYDAEHRRWAKRPTSATTNEYGSDWWGYAEADQIAATLNLQDYRYTDALAETAGHWLSDYVDGERKELIPGIRQDGSPVWTWPNTDTAKCNEWKNGYHSSEHALVFYLLGKNLEGEVAELHFAVPADDAETFVTRPYFFHGREVSRVEDGDVTIGGASLRKVRVGFDRIY